LLITATILLTHLKAPELNDKYKTSIKSVIFSIKKKSVIKKITYF